MSSSRAALIRPASAVAARSCDMSGKPARSNVAAIPGLRSSAPSHERVQWVVRRVSVAITRATLNVRTGTRSRWRTPGWACSRPDCPPRIRWSFSISTCCGVGCSTVLTTDGTVALLNPLWGASFPPPALRRSRPSTLPIGPIGLVHGPKSNHQRRCRGEWPVPRGP